MDVLKKWMGYLLALAAVLFLIAMWQSGGFNELLDKFHLPKVTY